MTGLETLVLGIAILTVVTLVFSKKKKKEKGWVSKPQFIKVKKV